MKGTELLIQNKFLKLLKKYTIDEITVDLLCDSVKIRRQTFYYHYKNVYDLIYSIFYTKELKPTNPKNYDAIIDNFLDFLYSDIDFYKEINASNARDVLVEFLKSFLIRAFQVYLTQYKVTTEDIQELSYFLASSITQQALYYYEKENNTKSNIRKRLNLFVNAKQIERLIINFKKAQN